MKPISFSKDLDEMNDAELRASLREFKSKYDEGLDEISELESEASEYKEQNENLMDTIDEIHPTFAEMYAEIKDMDEEMVADKFTVEELTNELDELSAFSLNLDNLQEDNEDDNGEAKFKDKPSKYQQPDGEKSDYQDRIDQFMAGRVKSY